MKRIVLCLCLLLPSAVFAAFDDVETSARATAMGGAFVAQGDDITALFYNPAGLVGVRRYELLASYEKLLVGLTDNSAIARNLLAFGSPLRIKGTYWGTVGLSWNSLSLDNLYEERKLTFGYGRSLGERLWWGFAVNQLSVAYGSDDYTRVNPLFDLGNQKSTFGVDIGFIKQINSVNVGLSVQNLNEPDVGIKYTNKIDRVINAGISVKQEAYDWNTELSLINKDYRIKTGTERLLFRKWLKDRVMVRGGLGIGSRDYRNIALGFGYRDAYYRLDYSFVYPLSGISETLGSHQIGLVFAWGKASESTGKEPPASPYEGYAELGGAAGQYGSTKGAGQGPASLKGLSITLEAPQEVEVSPDDRARARELIVSAQKMVSSGHYGAGLEKLKQADGIMKTNQEIKKSIVKLASIVDISTSIVTNDKRGSLLRKSIIRYMDNDADAVIVMTYAYQIWPKDSGIARVREVVNKYFPEAAANQRLLPGINIVDQLLQDSLDLIRSGRFIYAVATLEKVLDLEPNNVTALTRMGSAYWAMGKKDIARKHWRKVLQLDPGNTEVREFMKGN